MLQDQDIIDPPITAGDYYRIQAAIYTDSTKTELESTLAEGVIGWRLMGARGDLITKTTAPGSITVDYPQQGYITIDLWETETAGLSTGEYTHLAEFTIDGHKRGLFKGIAKVE
jgi:hypothetical protein